MKNVYYKREKRELEQARKEAAEQKRQDRILEHGLFKDINQRRLAKSLARGR